MESGGTEIGESTEAGQKKLNKGDRKSVTVLCWNIAGLANKSNEFWKFVNNYDVVGLETWLTQKEWEKWKSKLPTSHNWTCLPAKKEKSKGRAKGE